MKSTQAWIAALVPLLYLAPANAENLIKIGVLTDMTTVTADIAGEGSVAAAQMAVDDMASQMPDWKIELVSGDFQFKSELAATIAAEWYDRDGVNLIVDVSHSASALAVQELARTRNGLAFYSGAGTPKLVQDACSPHGVQWMYDQYTNPHALVQGLKSLKLKKWFFITADATGHIASEEAMRSFLIAEGLEVVGGVRVPNSTTDFSPYAIQAKSSGANVVAVIFGGAPTVRAVQAIRDFGLDVEIVSSSLFINDVKSIGLDAAQGLIYTDVFYWDMNDETRAWSKRFFGIMGKMPSVIQAGVYSEVLHYLKAVKAGGTTDADKVMEKVREIPINDFITKDGHVEINGQIIRDRHLWKVKAPTDSKDEWDLQELLVTVPGNQASFSPKDSGCPLVKNP